MKLRVLTLHFGEAPYLAVSREINERYCHRHGLEFAIGKPRDDGRHPLWSKVTLTTDALWDTDAVLYVDGDAVFVDHDRRPEVLFEHLGAAHAMLIGEDFSPGLANTGVWLVRNTQDVLAILRDWDAASEVDPSFAFRWPVDEAGFNKQVLPRHRSAIALMPRTRLDFVRGDFIRHHMAAPMQAKLLRLEQERRRLARRHGWPAR